MALFNPPHPGEILKEIYMIPLGIKQKELANGIGVTTKALSEIMNGHTSISTTMALRLSKAFDTTPEFWLNLQQDYNLHTANLTFDMSHIHHFKYSEQKKLSIEVSRNH